MNKSLKDREHNENHYHFLNKQPLPKYAPKPQSFNNKKINENKK